MPISYDYCAKVEDVVAQREFETASDEIAKLCTIVTSGIQVGTKDCNGTESPTLEYVEYTFKSKNLGGEFDFEMNCWVGIDQATHSDIYAGVDQSPFGKVCISERDVVQGGNATVAALKDAMETLYDEMVNAATSGSTVEFVLLTLKALVIAVIAIAGIVLISNVGSTTVAGVVVVAGGVILAAALAETLT